MENTAIDTNTLNETSVVTFTPAQLLEHWQGHRRISRRMIEVFPEKEFYQFSIGGMRTYADLNMEITDLAGAGVQGIATGDWSGYQLSADGGHTTPPQTKEEMLALWDAITDKINTYWPQIPAQRFQENDLAFGQYEGRIIDTLFYLIDNEIHHRAQGYVYLRALGIQPPFFWDRS
ncbi:hypothetical protein DYBT9275_06098 [Dyadobacter sp. CECT 9275]|uniref:Damage-inducible protein DinB n=1 Tax=Dyadobacter helix TaxID=2822344 RepID=A0A916NP61_9BACT|nr:DinB family protein [Dyadobacter sp. CECT 9275]CAG5018916.1 hypothetical protein DYBT9275_06098 [Dyadobacter sp. CECT 9275]